MSDVEWICEQNHQRVRWAEEITSQSRQSRDSSPQGEPRETDCHGRKRPRNDSEEQGKRIAAAPAASHISRSEYPASNCGTRLLASRNDMRGARVPADNPSVACGDSSLCTREPCREARRQRTRRAIRTASLFCAMMCGVSMVYVVQGVLEQDMATLVAGVIGAVVFLTSGWLMDERVEVLSA